MPSPAPSSPPPPGQRTTPGLAGAALVISVCVCLLVLLLAHRNPRVSLAMVLPATVLAQLASIGACAVLARRRPQAGWLQWAAAGLLAGALGAGCGLAAGAALLGRDQARIWARPALRQGLAAGCLLGGALASGAHLLTQGRRREHAALQAQAELHQARLRAEHELARTELQMLQARIEPHFLYNTLANLRQLIRSDSAGALAMTEQLIRYFKALTAALAQPLVSLENELALCAAFVEILRIRWGRDIDYRVALDAACSARGGQIRLPPGALLTLVENAMKHGLPADGSEPAVALSLAVCDGWLQAQVDDRGPGPDTRAPAAGEGNGLAVLSRRLLLQFGPHARLQLAAAPGGGCRARLDLPLEPS